MAASLGARAAAAAAGALGKRRTAPRSAAKRRRTDAMVPAEARAHYWAVHTCTEFIWADNAVSSHSFGEQGMG